MTSAARWQRLQALFEHLVALPEAERTAWLDSCEDDVGLKSEARALARADDETRGAITGGLAGAASRIASPPLADRQLGEYRLLEEIGSGGMGTVYLAERADDAFHHRVAIKLLRGLPTRDSAERMRRERQILASLSHAHIASLVGGGNAPDGTPYLVMEYVEGQPLNAFCAQRRPLLEERFALLRKICGAVHYAHQRLVVHRDLKPANVLVRADGEPVLLDFGIAKLLDSSGDGALTGGPLCTPAYASPEQRVGGIVSTASDIHGLGLLLFEAVTGARPEYTADERLVPPSQRAALGRQAREIDLIVARATHPEPDRRYESAAALGEDIDRHLRGLPVRAAPDTFAYRLGKVIRRHRIATGAAAAMLLMGMLFTWRIAAERDHALRAEAQARSESRTSEQVIDYLLALFRAAAPEQAGNRPITPRELVDRGRRELDTRLRDAPLARARVFAAIGDIYLELGQAEAAAESLRKAADIERDQGEPRQRATYLANLGYALNVAEQPLQAIAVLGEAIPLLGTSPANAGERADVLSTLGLAKARAGDLAGGRKSVEAAIVDAARAEGPNGIRVGQSTYALAEVEMRAGQLDSAEASAKRSIDLLRAQLADDSPEVIAATGFLSEIYQRQGRYAEAESVLRNMLATRLRTLDSGSVWAINVRNNLAQALQSQGRLFEAIELFRENLDHLRAGHHEATPHYTIALNNLASLIEQTGDYPKSLAMFRDVFETAQQRSPDSPDPHMATWRQNLGRSLMLNGDLAAAKPLLDHPIEGAGDVADLAWERARRLAHLAEWSRRAHQPEQALRLADQAQAAFLALHPATRTRLGGVARTRALALRDLGRLDEAEREFDRAIADLTAGSGAQANATLEAALDRTDLLLARGRVDAARPGLRRLAAPVEARFVAESPPRRLLAELERRLGASP